MLLWNLSERSMSASGPDQFRPEKEITGKRDKTRHQLVSEVFRTFRRHVNLSLVVMLEPEHRIATNYVRWLKLRVAALDRDACHPVPPDRPKSSALIVEPWVVSAQRNA